MELRFVFVLAMLWLCSFVLISNSELAVASFTYENPGDCADALPDITWNGYCTMTSDCSRGALNFTVTTENEQCGAANLGLVSELVIMDYTYAAFVFSDTAHCNVSYSTAYDVACCESFHNFCDQDSTYTIAGGYQLSVTSIKGLQEMNFTDA